MKCIYCSEDKDDSEFSLEHIIPQSMGGNILNNPLLRTNNVCKRCNSLCGLFVDNACLKNWLHQNAKSQSEWNMPGYSLISPSYIGILEDLSSEDEICDFWVFPQGSQVFCFYPKEKKYLAHVGGNPINRKEGKGKAVLVLSELASSNLNECKRTIESFYAFFLTYEKYAYNFTISNYEEIFCDFDEKTAEYKKKIDGTLNQQLNARVFLDILQINRFPCKIALALGFNLFGDKFLDTEYAKELRKGLWYKNGEKNGVRGTNFIFSGENENLLEMLKVGKANTLAVIKAGNILSCTMSIYGNLSTIMICDNLQNMGKCNVANLDEGIFFAWHPQLGISTEQLSLIDLINYKSGNKPNCSLKKLENVCQIDN